MIFLMMQWNEFCGALSIRNPQQLILLFDQAKDKKLTNISFSSLSTQFYESRIFCLFTFWVFFSRKFLINIKIHTPKNANISRYIKKKEKTLCNTLNWGNWNSGFVKLGVHWAEQDTNFVENIYVDYEYFGSLDVTVEWITKPTLVKKYR